MEIEHNREVRKRRLDRRGATTYLLFFSFVVLLISGLVLFVAPSGKVARVVDWQLLGLIRSQWQSLHLGFSAVFVVVAATHLTFNRRSFLHRFRKRANPYLKISTEVVLAFSAALLLAMAAILDLPPISNVHSLNQYFRQTFWSAGPPAGVAKSTTDVEKEPTSQTLPENHPRVGEDEPCGQCHRN